MSGPRLTVRSGHTTAPAGDRIPSARRLALSGAEWAVLVEGRLTDLPPGFGPAPTAASAREAAVAALTARGVLRPQPTGAEPVPAVTAQLAVLQRPLLTLQLEVTGAGGAMRGWFAVGAGVVVGVLTAPDGGVELSLAPAVQLGAELGRAVPEAGTVAGTGPTGPAGDPLTGSLTGRLPLALLQDPATPGVDAGLVALAADLERRTAGSLSCLVLGRTRQQRLGAGQVSWLATDAGWIGLRPRLDDAPDRQVDLVPVRPADLGGWVAPTVAALLEADDDHA